MTTPHITLNKNSPSDCGQDPQKGDGGVYQPDCRPSQRAEPQLLWSRAAASVSVFFDFVLGGVFARIAFADVVV